MSNLLKHFVGNFIPEFSNKSESVDSDSVSFTPSIRQPKSDSQYHTPSSKSLEDLSLAAQDVIHPQVYNTYSETIGTSDQGSDQHSLVLQSLEHDVSTTDIGTKIYFVQLNYLTLFMQNRPK